MLINGIKIISSTKQKSPQTAKSYLGGFGVDDVLYYASNIPIQVSVLPVQVLVLLIYVLINGIKIASSYKQKSPQTAKSYLGGFGVDVVLYYASNILIQVSVLTVQVLVLPV